MRHHDCLDIFRSLNTSRQPNTTTNDERLQPQKPQVIGAIHEQPLPPSKNSWVLGRRSLGRKSSTSHRRSQRRLTASRCDGASATIDTAAVTSKAAGTRERDRSRDASVCVLLCVGASRWCTRTLRQSFREREANAKWLQVWAPVTETKRHVRPYAQYVTDDPFLNRVSQVRILPGAPSVGRCADASLAACSDW
jgi:hypothetical protein